MTNFIKKIKNMLERPNLKILVISDLHNAISDEEIEKIRKQKFDICVLLGDIGERAMKIIHRNCIIYRSTTYGVLGNHDSFDLYEKFFITQPSFEETITVYKNEQPVHLKFLSGSVRYKEGDYPMMTQEESKKLCTHKHGDCDILFSHDYPAKMYFKNSGYYSSHAGLKGINQYLKSHHCPKLLVHGHLHKSLKSTYDRGEGYDKDTNPTVISVYRCAVINYKTLRTKVLF